MSFTYSLSQTQPNRVETKKIVGGGNLVSEYQFIDGLGRVVQTQRAAAGGGAVIKTTNYDDQGREYFVDNDYWTASITPGDGFFTPTTENNVPSQVVSSYDPVGRVTKAVLKSTGTQRSQTVTAYSGADRVDTTPPSGGTATSVFTNSLGQKSKLTQYLSGSPTGAGQSTTYAYDGGGRMTRMSDPSGNQWSWSFDLLGNRVGQSDPDSGTASATYDLVGNMTSTTDARGVSVTTTFDELNRKTATYAGSASGALLSSWAYDSVRKGLVSSSTSYAGSVPGTPGLAYTKSVDSYDAGGNPLKQTVSIPAGAPAFGGTTYSTTSYYNADSSLLAKSVPTVGGLPGEIIRYSYDSRGALSGIRGASMVLANTVFTPTGRLGQFNRFNGTNDGYSTYGYDVATGSVLAVKDNAVFANVGHYVADRTFTWDDAGNVLSASAHATHPDEQTQLACYTYDGLRQLTRAWTPDASAGCASAPSTAGLAGPAPFWLEYAYDNPTGNRTSVVAKTPSGGSTSSTFAYPAAGTARPHAVDTVTGGAGAGSYGYDQAGNQVSRPGQTVTYDEAGKVATVVAGAETQQNVFDAEGNLLLRTSTTQGAALFLGDTTLTQAAGSTVVCGFRTYTGAEGKPVAQRSAKTGTAGSTLSWLFMSLDGTVDVQTNAATGATVHAYRDPFGAPAGTSGQGWADSTGYLNKQVAEGTGLTNVGARTYDAVLGKFLSVDPVIDTTLPQQNTGYTYAGNNPTTYTDPTGLRLDEGCGWATTCKAAIAKGATGTPKPVKKQLRPGKGGGGCLNPIESGVGPGGGHEGLCR
ncbi:RHS repeat-associated core domain-containing protein [Microbacterium sp.]|uniref:RHS repeat-associated core domain-containing protein n=1 Tax=Microbacterium sp. TaxID=51671 RepID=UPI003A9093AF